MGFIQPTTYALINVTDFPFFVVPLNEIEHVHFERVFSSSKTCDMKIIMKVGLGFHGQGDRCLCMCSWHTRSREHVVLGW